jgi:hypothetical protein
LRLFSGSLSHILGLDPLLVAFVEKNIKTELCSR